MSPMHPTEPKRDLRLDFLRGLALITIFVNHVPGTVLENLTSRNFGFSDAAEAFVLMSGIAAALSYTKTTRSSLADAFRKSSARAFKLYWVHLAITALAIISVVWLSDALENDQMLSRNNMDTVLREPWTASLGLVSLGHQLGYFNILPLYCILMLSAPAMIYAALRSPIVVLAGSASVWLLAGYTQTNLPNFPTDGGWFLNPLSWQLLFAIGVVVGVAAKEGRAFCRYHPLLFALACAYLVGSCLVVQLSLWPLISAPSLPDILFGFNKTFLTLPRLLHVVALAYVLSHLQAVRTASISEWSKPIRFLGSNSLAVFATGSVVCIALQTVKNAVSLDGMEDFAVLAAGLGVQFVAAAWDDVLSGLKHRVHHMRLA